LNTLYQTLEDRNNPDYIEDNGPFICRRVTAWLGDGYYFWDSLIELAHKWGGETYKKMGKGYIVCSAKIDGWEKCYDLLGDLEKVKEFRDISTLLLEQNIFSHSELLVANVLTYMRENGLFPYEAIRVHPINSFNFAGQTQQSHLPFVKKHKAYLDMIPAVQVCLLKPNGLGLNDFKIVFPDDYVIEIA